MCLAGLSDLLQNQFSGKILKTCLSFRKCSGHSINSKKADAKGDIRGENRKKPHSFKMLGFCPLKGGFNGWEDIWKRFGKRGNLMPELGKIENFA